MIPTRPRLRCTSGNLRWGLWPHREQAWLPQGFCDRRRSNVGVSLLTLAASDSTHQLQTADHSHAHALRRCTSGRTSLGLMASSRASSAPTGVLCSTQVQCGSEPARDGGLKINRPIAAMLIVPMRPRRGVARAVIFAGADGLIASKLGSHRGFVIDAGPMWELSLLAMAASNSTHQSLPCRSFPCSRAEALHERILRWG